MENILIDDKNLEYYLDKLAGMEVGEEKFLILIAEIIEPSLLEEENSNGAHSTNFDISSSKTVTSVARKYLEKYLHASNALNIPSWLELLTENKVLLYQLLTFSYITS
jgi:hypothetical protein